ncbi:hypothetical protein ACFUJY_29315 [Streptomyces sp. NPDC057249]|uniref:hypothetical protein n=1 Tax=Streptomyces sp. NPDC057249 TaxID=3346067 RepID=UPI00362B4DE7
MTQLTVSVDDQLAGQVADSARRYGLPVDKYVEHVLRAAEAPGAPDREARATELARGALREWDAAGRSEHGAMSMSEVFGE